MQIAQAQVTYKVLKINLLKGFFDVGVDGFEPPTLCL